MMYHTHTHKVTSHMPVTESPSSNDTLPLQCSAEHPTYTDLPIPLILCVAPSSARMRHVVHTWAAPATRCAAFAHAFRKATRQVGPLQNTPWWRSAIRGNKRGGATHIYTPLCAGALLLLEPSAAPRKSTSVDLLLLGCAGHPHAHPRDKRQMRCGSSSCATPHLSAYSYHSLSERTSRTTLLFGTSPVALAPAFASDSANILATWMLVISGTP